MIFSSFTSHGGGGVKIIYSDDLRNRKDKYLNLVIYIYIYIIYCCDFFKFLKSQGYTSVYPCDL